MWLRVVLVVVSLMAAGCSGLLVKSEPAPVYYQLDYPATRLDCPQRFVSGVRVWEFAADTPFERTEMVVAEDGGALGFSGGHQWVAYPGRMLAERLVRDLATGSVFPLVVGSTSPINVPLELTGRVGSFIWQREGAGGRAVLEVEVSLVERGGANRVLFRRSYRCACTGSRDDAATFAAAMSAAAAQFSRDLQRDLCAAAASVNK